MEKPFMFILIKYKDKVIFNEKYNFIIFRRINCICNVNWEFRSIHIQKYVEIVENAPYVKNL